MKIFNRQETGKLSNTLALRNRVIGAAILKRRLPSFETLEERIVFSTFIVTTAAGLAPAIAAANTTMGSDTIDLQFSTPTAIPLTTAQGTINPSAPDVAGSGLAIVNQGVQVAIVGSGGGSIFTITGNSGAVQIIGQTAPIVLENGITSGNGGAINDGSGAALSVTNVIFTGNKAANGGAIYAAKGSLTVADSKFGPGPGSQVPKLPPTQGNIAAGVGGAIDYVGGSTLTVSNSTFVSNIANGAAGGAIYFNGGGTLTVGRNSVFQSNQATSSTPKLTAMGGAIAVVSLNAKNPPGTLIDSTIFLTNSARGSVGTSANNLGGAADGGAIHSGGGALTLTNSQFVANQAIGGPGSTSTSGAGGAGGAATGGAVDHAPSLVSAALSISGNVSFLNNLAVGGAGGKGGSSNGAGGNGGYALGGALADYATGSAAIAASFYGDGAKAGSGGAGIGSGAGGAGGNAQGGAILIRSSSGSVKNSVFGSNVAQGGNGGASSTGNAGVGGSATGGAVENDRTLTLSATTFTNNSATGGAGGSANSPHVGGTGGSATGGAVFNSKASLTINTSGFFGNTVIGGAGGATAGSSAKGGTAGAGSGGAVASTLTLNISTTSFQSNSATGGVGGATKSTSSASGAGGDARGGAVDDEGFPNSGSFSGSGLTFSLNSALGGVGGASIGTGGAGGNAYGGAILANNVKDQVSTSTFTMNSATGGDGSAGASAAKQGPGGGGQGGGVRNFRNLVLTSNSFIANSATGGAGTDAGNSNGEGLGGGVVSSSGIALSANQPANLTMTDDTFTENTAVGGTGTFGGVGGGFYNNDSKATVSRCIFRENTAIGLNGSNGVSGGIYNGNQGGVLNLSSSTVTFNSATTAYGGIYAGGTTTLTSDNITFNNAPSSPDM